MKGITNEEAIKECVKIQAFGVSECQVAAMEVAIQAIKRESSTEQFAKWVATEIFDDMWEYNKDAFGELACRKLAKLGIVRAKGDEWEWVEPQEKR